MRHMLPILLIALSFSGCLGNKPPVFTSDLNNYVITENTPVGSIIYKLEATDPEGSPLKYGIMGTDKFTVDEKTGQVSVNRPIDREAANTVKFSVTVEDVVEEGGENNLVSIPVRVNILDVNDNPPIFENDSQFESVVLREDAKPGTKIASLSITDADMTGLALTVNCTPAAQSPEACETFGLDVKDSTAGYLRADIKLSKKLNYNQRRLYQFQLSCTDGEHTSQLPVLIQVEDVQNKAPVFLGSLSGRVGEHANAGTVVMVVKSKDGDLGKPRDVKVTLLTNPSDAFSLDSASGLLTTTRPLDREVLGSYLELKVKAVEVIPEGQSDELSEDDVTETIETLTILVDDVNDFTPQFNKKEYWTSVEENALAGTPLADVDMEITDLDAGVNSEFTIRIDGPLAEYFEIHPNVAKGTARPVIRVTKKFDFENPNERKFLLLIVAQNIEEPKLFSTATVTVVTNDVNDNAPKFDKEVYTISVPEATAGGTLLGSISAYDADSKEFGTDGVRYQLVGAGSKKFRVNEKTGDIYLNTCASQAPNNASVVASSCLDYETQNTLDLLFTAHDNQKHEGFVHSIVPLQIRLVDSNDNPPYFAGSFQRILKESSEQFEPRFYVTAKDKDKSATLTYRIMEATGVPFGIDKITGEILIRSKQLQPGNYSFRVEVSDSAFKAYTPVHVEVTDVNDHAPVFDPETETELMISEDVEVGEEIFTVLATDADLGQNGFVLYKIEKGDFGHFEMDEESGVVTLKKPLDFYKNPRYSFQIVAYDQGEPSLNTYITVDMHVLSVFQVLPKIFPAVQRFQVSSSIKKGDVVGQLTTAGGTFKNSSEYEFHLSAPVELRTIDNKVSRGPSSVHDWFMVTSAGQVIAKTAPKRDLVALLNYTVVITSRLTRSEDWEHGTLLLSLYDVNDQPPKLDDMEIEVEEELPKGMTILTLDTEDVERGHTLSYVVTQGYEYISVDNKTGEIKVAGRLDYDEKPVYNCTIMVMDSGVPQLSSTAGIVIHLLNINDNTPVFSKDAYEAQVDEHSAPGTFVASVSATDKDGDVVSYGIVPGPWADAFAIDRLGSITTSDKGTQMLDREEISSDHGLITFGIFAKDSSRTGFSTVSVVVRDINDNAPVMPEKSYKISLYAPLVAMQQLVAIEAIGGDLPESDSLKYSILSGSQLDDAFMIEESSGILRTSRAFDKPGDYKLVVEATDEGGNTTAARSEVLIQVLANNVMRPEFVFPNKGNWTIHTAESDAVEIKKYEEDPTFTKVIGTLQAFDGDEGENGRLEYFFVNEKGDLVNEYEAFRLDSKSGSLQQVKPLDRERINAYQLVVAAKDGGKPSTGVHQHVLAIVVHDVDDHLPAFSLNKIFNFTIKENSPANTFIGQVAAFDMDEGQNAQIFYFLASDDENRYKNDDLRVDIKSGKIYTQAILDKEKISEYIMFVRASPSPIVTKQLQKMSFEEAMADKSIAIVSITVIDENDNPVRFAEKQYFAAVNVEAEPGRFVMNMNVDDKDSSSKGSMKFYLHGSNLIVNDFQSGGSLVPSPFRIDETSGRLTVSSSAVRQYGGGSNRFTVQVGVKETVSPYYEDRTLVNVWVVDMSQQVIVTVKATPDEVPLKDLLRLLSNITDTNVLATKLTPHVSEDQTVNHKWSDIFITAISKHTMKVIPVAQFIQALDLGHDQFRVENSNMELYSALPAMGNSDSLEYVYANRESFDTAFASLVALVALICLSVAAAVAVCCCLRYLVSSKKAANHGHMQSTLKYALHPNEASVSGTPSVTRHMKGSHHDAADPLDELGTDNPLWTEHHLKTYEEQELTMCVATEMDASVAGVDTEDGKSVVGSIAERHAKLGQRSSFGHVAIASPHAYATLNHNPEGRKDHSNLLLEIGYNETLQL